VCLDLKLEPGGATSCSSGCGHAHARRWEVPVGDVRAVVPSSARPRSGQAAALDDAHVVAFLIGVRW
jgi:hypothetical protein